MTLRAQRLAGCTIAAVAAAPRTGRRGFGAASSTPATPAEPVRRCEGERPGDLLGAAAVAASGGNTSHIGADDASRVAHGESPDEPLQVSTPSVRTA